LQQGTVVVPGGSGSMAPDAVGKPTLGEGDLALASYWSVSFYIKSIFYLFYFRYGPG